MSRYRDFSSPYFPEFGLNTGKYGPEGTPYYPYLNTFHSVLFTLVCLYLFLVTYSYLCSLILLYEFDKIDEIWEIWKLKRNFLDLRAFLVLTMTTEKQPP